MSQGTALVVGFGVTGQGVARHLVARGWTVDVVDDHPSDRTRAIAAEAGVTIVEAPDEVALADLVSRAQMVIPGPGVAPRHPVYRAAAAAGVPVLSEIELGASGIDAPLVAVTGTNGKTTVTTMVAEMLVETGRRAVAAGNIGLALVDVVDQDVDVVVVETSSFQLQFTDQFRPHVAVWLNLAEDHLDWHPDMAHYAAAKARIWANQGPDDVAVVNADDPAVMAAATSAPSHVVTFSVETSDADWRLDGERLVCPEGVVVSVDELPRCLPHDIANGLAAAAAATSAGGDLDACRRVLRSFRGLPHRVELVEESGGVRYYDDSKATTPASVLAALRGLDSVVLIAGGRNKGLDLTVLRAAAGRVRAVVAIGDDALDVVAAFDGVAPVETADSMDGAVRAARLLAQSGDAILLSPGCASYDWYTSYSERGDDFARAVREQIGSAR